MTVWAAIALSYQTNYPVGFFVGTMSAAAYAVGRAWTHARARQAPYVKISGGRPKEVGVER